MWMLGGRDVGLLGCRDVGMLGCLPVGRLACWPAGLLACWPAGLLAKGVRSWPTSQHPDIPTAQPPNYGRLKATATNSGNTVWVSRICSRILARASRYRL